MKLMQILLIGTLFIAGCDGSVFDGSIEDAVRAGLKDPDSAKFGEKFINNDRACILVNAKNSYGGYTGTKVVYLRKISSQSWFVTDFDGDICSVDALKEKEVSEKENEKRRAQEAKEELLKRPYR